jgi:hypothetical protein
MPLSIGKAWESASRFLRRELRLVAPVALALFAIPIALAEWVSPSVSPAQPSEGPGWLISLVVLIAALTGLMTIAGLAIGWSGNLGSAISRAFKRVLGLLAALALIYLPITILAVLALAMVLGGAGITDPSQLTPELLARTPSFTTFVIGLTVVLLLVFTRIFPMSAIAFVETGNPIGLIGRSWRLTAGHFFRLLGLLLLLLIASAIASAAVTFPAGSLAVLVAGEIAPFSLSALIVALFKGAMAAAIWAINAAITGCVYAQLTGNQTGVPDVKRAE